jgi:hypothetical protein
MNPIRIMQAPLQFEAMRQLSAETKGVARAVLERLLLKHAARRFAAQAKA